jgi:hypothetical protein
VPSLAAAKLALNDPQNRFARLMWQRMDKFSFRQSDQERADNMVRGAYDLAREHVMRGGALPELPVAKIEQQAEKRKPASEETVNKSRAEVAALYGVANAA